jgi:hypothetical protein
VVTSPANPALNTSATATVSCPAGTVLLGGGFTLSGSLSQLTAVVTESRPADTTTWTATARNYAIGIGSFGIQAYAVCSA